MLKRNVFLCALLLSQMAMGSADAGDPSLQDPAAPAARRTEIFEGWLAPHLSASQKEELLKAIKARQSYAAQPYKIEGGVRCVGRHYGQLTPFTVIGLNHVRMIAGLTRVPKVLDIGAGDGYHAALFALAGAHVTLFENDPSLVDMGTKKNVPGQTLVKMLKGYMPVGVQVKDRTRIIVEDASQGLSVPAHRAQYDFANLANVLHTMTPTQATSCVKGVFNALKPGGVVCVRVQTLGAVHAATGEEGDAFAFYCREVEKGSPFPGWFGLMSYLHGFSSRTPLVSLPQDSQSSPMESRMTMAATPMGPPMPVSTGSVFAFDPATLSRLFEGAGFESGAMRFEMLDGSLERVLPGQETFVSALESPGAQTFSPLLRTSYGATNLCYITRKPE